MPKKCFLNIWIRGFSCFVWWLILHFLYARFLTFKPYFWVLFIFNTELIFAQDKDVLIKHPSLRAGVSKNQHFYSCDSVACLLKGMCGIETMKYWDQRRQKPGGEKGEQVRIWNKTVREHRWCGFCKKLVCAVRGEGNLCMHSCSLINCTDHYVYTERQIVLLDRLSNIILDWMCWI